MNHMQQSYRQCTVFRYKFFAHFHKKKKLFESSRVIYQMKWDDMCNQVMDEFFKNKFISTQKY